MEICITHTQTAQLEAQTEHFTVEQMAVYSILSNNTQREAYIASIPVPVHNTGPLYPVFTYKGAKVLGIPTWKLAKSFIGGGTMADVVDAQSASIKAGTMTTEEANAEWGMVLVHSDDSELDTGDLDTAGARATRDARDAEYRATHPKSNGTGTAQVFTPVP